MNDLDLNEENKVVFLKLKKEDAQYFIEFLKENFDRVSIIDQRYKTEQEKNYKLFPLIERKNIHDILVKKIRNHISVELITKKGILNPNFKYRTLEEALNGKIPPIYVNLIPSSYDVIGSVAILEFEKPDQINNKDFIDYKCLVANAVIDVNKNVKSVFEKKSEIKGSYRLRDLVYLSGENKTETIHRENNCVFHLDIKTTFFSPRLVYERRRISESYIHENEVIIDMFTGVGPFSIQIAKLKHVEIHAFDLNPNAIEFLKKNIYSNQLKGTIFPYNMNIRDLLNPTNQIGKKMKNNIDRIIMNLPEKSIDFIDVACFLMRKSGGVLHFYKISDKPDPENRTVKLLKKMLNKFEWDIDKVLDSKIVKSYSPKADLVAIDLDIKYLS
ncbi:MAG: class I SAM-dependent methyltransferase family protein [Promethearchaeota archaeon]